MLIIFVIVVMIVVVIMGMMIMSVGMAAMLTMAVLVMIVCMMVMVAVMVVIVPMMIVVMTAVLAVAVMVVIAPMMIMIMAAVLTVAVMVVVMSVVVVIVAVSMMIMRMSRYWINQVQERHPVEILDLQRIQHTIHPSIGMTANINKKICIADRSHIPWGGLKRMTLRAGRNEHRQLNPIPCNLPHKIILRENGSHYS